MNRFFIKLIPQCFCLGRIYMGGKRRQTTIIQHFGFLFISKMWIKLGNIELTCRWFFDEKLLVDKIFLT
jgi:hypothetical protein